MSEALVTSGPEKPQQRFSTQVRNSMSLLHAELDKSHSFIQALHEMFFEVTEKGKASDSPILFDEVVEGKALESYEYSAALRPGIGIIPIDALSLKRRDISLFIQLARSTKKHKTASVVELTIGDNVYYGREALARIHEAFPKFYPRSLDK